MKTPRKPSLTGGKPGANILLMLHLVSGMIMKPTLQSFYHQLLLLSLFDGCDSLSHHWDNDLCLCEMVFTHWPFEATACKSKLNLNNNYRGISFYYDTKLKWQKNQLSSTIHRSVLAPVLLPPRTWKITILHQWYVPFSVSDRIFSSENFLVRIPTSPMRVKKTFQDNKTNLSLEKHTIHHCLFLFLPSDLDFLPFQVLVMELAILSFFKNVLGHAQNTLLSVRYKLVPITIGRATKM